MPAPRASSESSALERIELLRSTMRCFVCSLLGLVPVLGLPFATAAILGGRKLRPRPGAEWHPAEGYLRAARRLGPLGFLVSLVFLFVVLVVLPAIATTLCPGRSGSS